MRQTTRSTLDSEHAAPRCDMPCRIYDPVTAQISALTVIRKVGLIEGLISKKMLSLDEQAELFELITQKEKHIEQVSQEIKTLCRDCLKKMRCEKNERISDLAQKIVIQGSMCKQKANREFAIEYLDLVNQFAEVFWKTKGLNTYSVTCPYPPYQSIVHPVLQYCA